MTSFARVAVFAGLCAGCVTTSDTGEMSLLAQRFPLGATLEQTRTAARAHCASLTEVEYDAQLAAPYREQTQIDCLHYDFRGAPRRMELLVNEGELGFYWLLIGPGELEGARTLLRQRFGEPDCVNSDYTAYAAHGVALRNVPPEFLIAKPDDFTAITGCVAPGR